MDASKAFDMVNHWTLFKVLIDKGVPLIIVRILYIWYRTQTACVRWGTNVYNPFDIANGVRQGGLLSPKLFNVYLDGLSVLLNSLPVGCNIGGTVINHLAYADDVVLISPSVKGLHRLVDQCVSFGDDFDISFNRRKTVCMAITANNYVMLNHPSLLLRDAPLTFVTSFKCLGFHINSSFND